MSITLSFHIIYLASKVLAISLHLPIDMSKREKRISKMYSASQKQNLNAIKLVEQEQAEANLFYVILIAFLAFISGV